MSNETRPLERKQQTSQYTHGVRFARNTWEGSCVTDDVTWTLNACPFTVARRSAVLDLFVSRRRRFRLVMRWAWGSGLATCGIRSASMSQAGTRNTGPALSGRAA